MRNDIIRFILKKDVKNFVLQILLIIICGAVLGVIIKNIEIYNSDKKSNVSALATGNEYELVYPIEVESNLTDYFSDPTRLNNLKDFYIAFSNNPNYIYLDKVDQGIYMKNTLGADIFLYGYENGLENYFDDELGNRYYLFNNITINLASQNYYNFKVTEGRLFNSEDFKYGDTIPVMLGYDYKDYYNIGDVFTGEYLSCYFNYEVIGILDKNTAIDIQNEVVFLDRYIVSPSVTVPNAPQTHEELFYQSASYLQKLEGNVILSEDFGLPEFTNTLETLKNTYSMFDFSIIKQSSIVLTFFQLTCYAGVDSLVLFCCIIMLLLTILDICFIINNLSRFSYFYGINILNGCETSCLISVNTIYFSIIHLLGSILVCCILIPTEMFSIYLLAAMLLWNVAAFLISKYAAKKSLYKNIDLMIRGY